MEIASKEHKAVQSIIKDALSKKGYTTELEHRIGKYTYDVVAWKENHKKIFIEVYMYPPRVNVEPPNIKCSGCDYYWFTRSKKHMVTCPNCLNKVKVGNNVNKEQ